MVKRRKATALLQYSILITIVALVMATMNVYLKRSIQAKVKTLTDVIICDRQLGSLNDVNTEKSDKTTISEYSLTQNEFQGGGVSTDISSVFSVGMNHQVENLDKVDYGRNVVDLENPAVGYVLYSDTATAQESAQRVDSLEESTVGAAGNQNAGEDSAASLENNISAAGGQSSSRGSAGGTMPFYSDSSTDSGSSR